MMAQPPILKAKSSDRPALRDLANFVVPRAIARWYYLGLELFDPQDEATLNSMKKENKTSQEQCTEVLNHWLVTKKNATWNKLIKSLKSKSVNLPNLARDIEKMLDTRSVLARGKHKFQKKFSRKKSQTLPTITDVSSSYESSDVERSDAVENEESDEETTFQTSPSSSRYTFQRTDSVQSLCCKQPSMPMSMTNCQFESHSRSRSMSTTSLPAAFHSMEHDVDKLHKEKDHKKHKHQYRNLSKDEHTKEDFEQQNKIILSGQGCNQETENIAKQLKELKDQLNYKDMYENEVKKRIEVENQFREAYTKKLEQEIVQLKSQLTNKKEVTKDNDLSTLQSKPVTKMFEDNEKKLQIELVARDEMYEKRITKVVDTFNRQLKSNGEAHKNELYNLQLKVQEFKREGIKNLEDSEKLHRKEICNLQLKVEELKREQAKKLKDSEELHKKGICNLQCKVEELKKEEAKKLKDIEEAHKKEMYNLTLQVEKFKKEEVKKLEERFKEHKLLIETLKKENKELTKQLAVANETLVSKFNAKFEVFEKSSKEENEKIRQKLEDVQTEINRQAHSLKQQLQLKDKTEQIMQEKKSEEYIKQHDKSHRQDKNDSKPVDEKVGDTKICILSSDGNSSCEELDANVLALMKKTAVYRHPALCYDIQTATISIYCSDPTQKEKIRKELITAYQVTNGNLQTHTFSVDDKQQASVIVNECTEAFNHTYFQYYPEKKEVLCLSTDAQQMQDVTAKVKLIKQDFNSLKDSNMKLMTITSPASSRKVTIKCANIVEEEVDIIVNAANNNLKHDGGVAADINKASGNAIQRECTKLMYKTKPAIAAGDVIKTTAGGRLKCKLVIHAVGPVISLHPDQCESLLKKACIKAMDAAINVKATSISFPPIRFNVSDVPTDLVANVMLSTLCSYRCHPAFLSDVRIVIADRPTFEVFLYIFRKEKQNLKLPLSQNSTATPVGTVPPPPGFGQKQPSHIQPSMPYTSYSHAVRQKHDGQPSSQKTAKFW